MTVLSHRLLVIALLAVGCRSSTRPESVPAHAVQLGTAEKYLFIDCKRDVQTIACTIFDSGGRRFGSGYYELQGPGTFDPDDADDYVGFNGRDVLLRRGRRLKLREPPIRPANVPIGAVWGGGPECGNYVECAHSSGNLYDCVVYSELSGAIVVSEPFRLYGATISNPRADCGVRANGRIYVDDGFLQSAE